MNLRDFLLTATLMIFPVGLTPVVCHAVMPWQQPDAKWVTYRSATVIGSTAAVVLAVPQGQWAKIAGWNIEVDKVAAATATVKVGVVTAINSSSGTVRWFLTKTLASNVSNTTNIDQLILWPSSIDTRVVGGGPERVVGTSGTTPGFATSDQVTYANAEALEYQDDVILPTTESGQVTPKLGSILTRVVGGGTSATAAATVSLLYFVEP